MAGLPSPWGPRRVVWTIHRWLGLASGAVVFVVALSGALYALAPEVTDLYLRRYARVEAPAGAPALPASTLIRRAEIAAERAAGPLPAGTRRWLTLRADRARAAVHTVAPPGSSGWYEVYVDPYRGDVRLVRDMLWDPLGILLRVHQSLLLPDPLGRRLVGVAVLLFIPSLLTGLVLWFPRRPGEILRASALRTRLTIARNHDRFRVVFDLHRALGGYVMLAALVLALTGLVWAFAWVDRGVYWVATGGHAPRERAAWRSGPPSDGRPAAIDEALAAVARAVPDAVRIDVGLPGGPHEAISVCTNPDAATSHRTECRWFDQYTGIEVGADLYRDQNAGDRVRALAYDIHVGRIAGFGGRAVAFLASLATASLPVTGALIWWSRPRR